MLTGEQFAKMIISAANNLTNNKELLNEMNVFPVPDGDTGKNMSMSISGAKETAEGMLGKNPDTCDVADKVAMATLRGARGNSGVILSQLLRGFAKEMKGKKEVSPARFAKCFVTASQTAYSAVMKPTEGTILTVARECGEYVQQYITNKTDLLTVMREAVKAANESLDRTPELLPKLKAAGVVDAGGKGWVVALEGMLYYLENEKVVELTEGADVSTKAVSVSDTEDEEITFTYCTEFLIDKTSPEVDAGRFKNTISKIGDCVVVIDQFDFVKVHIHTDNPGIVIQNALKLGSLNDIKIDNMRFQHNEKIGNTVQETPKEPPKKCAVVAVSAGEGYSAIMKELGVTDVIEGGQTMNPSAGDILKAVENANAETVYVLPNNKNIIMAAEAARDMAECKVVVINTTSVPQGISVMLGFDPEADSDTNAEAMSEIIDTVVTGSVTYAVRDSSNNGIEIKEGQIIGLGIGGIVANGEDINEVALNVCRNLISEETGIVTVYYGADITEEQAEKLANNIESEYSDIDVSVQFGGQPIYYYNISAE